ncbi:MAG: sarcosine oxidase subunit delta, partial [Pseudomonadota bacterium]
DHANAEVDPWLAYVFDRENPRGRHEEYWQHTGGCRAWLKVTRDTLTHEVFRIELVGAHAGQPPVCCQYSSWRPRGFSRSKT